MSEYEEYWLTGFPLINSWARLEIIMVIKKKNTSIFVILQSTGIIVIKSKETRVVTYTCKYYSGYLIPII